MLNLTSVDTFHITARGIVHTFEGISGLNPRPLKGQRVIINGKFYTVEGVETYALLDATGHAFGLCVGFQAGEPLEVFECTLPVMDAHTKGTEITELPKEIPS